MRVAHNFEVVQQAEMAAVVCLGYVDPFCRRRIDIIPNPKIPPYMHLWVGVRVVLLCLSSPPALRLGAWGWCMLPAGVFLMPGSGALQVGGRGRSIGAIPLGGRKYLARNFLL